MSEWKASDCAVQTYHSPVRSAIRSFSEAVGPTIQTVAEMYVVAAFHKEQSHIPT